MKNCKSIWQNAGMNCRIGTTSYIIPADILPNLNFLKEIVEDVELVLFESDEFSNLPTKADVREMGRIADGAGLTFTVHLPLDAYPGAENENVRKQSADKWHRVMDLMEVLKPFGWVVHLNDPPGQVPYEFGSTAFPGEAGGAPGNLASKNPPWDNWLHQCGKTLDELISRTKPETLCIETLSYDFGRVFPLVVEKDCAVCMDIGHLVMTGRDIPACMDAWLDQTRIIHLHGVQSDGRDHVDLRHFDTRLLNSIVNTLKRCNHKSRVLTLEIFSMEDLEHSLSIVTETVSQQGNFRMPK
ncbi:MAG: cobamide remodeling phosphodiesterase CbiR [Desulfosalsimonadaceae bacterium]